MAEKKSKMLRLIDNSQDFQFELAHSVVEYLNTKINTSYKCTKPTLFYILKRIADGFEFDDFKNVIDKKTEQWLSCEKMCKFLRPSTLFADCHFEEYLNEITIPKNKNSMETFLKKINGGNS